MRFTIASFLVIILKELLKSEVHEVQQTKDQIQMDGETYHD